MPTKRKFQICVNLHTCKCSKPIDKNIRMKRSGTMITSQPLFCFSGHILTSCVSSRSQHGLKQLDTFPRTNTTKSCPLPPTSTTTTTTIITQCCNNYNNANGERNSQRLKQNSHNDKHGVYTKLNCRQLTIFVNIMWVIQLCFRFKTPWYM